MGLQLPQSGGISLKHQIVAGIATKDFYLGQFGLGPKATNFTNFDTPDPSFFWSMKNQSVIPSLSWGYTAGAKHRLKGVPASLVFGGYDASRFTPNNMNFTFNTDDSRQLTVGIQTIQASNTLQGVMSMLPSGILALVDSTFPEIVSYLLGNYVTQPTLVGCIGEYQYQEYNSGYCGIGEISHNHWPKSKYAYCI